MTTKQRGAERSAEGNSLIGDHLFQAMFMAMDEGAVARNGIGEIVAVNPAAESILGLSATELTGLSSADFARTLKFIREDETPFPWEVDPGSLALQTGKPQRNVRMGAHRPDGTLVWISINAHPLLSDGESRPYGVVTTFRDVTEHKASEQQLKQALEFTEGVINAIPDLLFEADRNGTCLNVWARTPELLAVHNEALLGKTISDVVTSDSAEVALSAFREAEEKGLSFGKIVRVVIPQGERWFELSVSKKPGGDVPGRFIVLSRDVTQRKRMEDDIRRRELEFSILAESMPDNVVRHDRQGRVRYVNPALLASIPPEFSVVVGESLVETFPGNAGKADLHRLIMRVIETGAPAEVEFQLRTLYGEMRIHDVRYVAERDSNGEIVGVLGIGRDITERKRMEDDIRRRELEFRSLAENMPDNVVRYDGQARAQYFNPAMKASLAPGFLPVLGESPIQTHPGKDAVANYQRVIEQVIATGTPVELEFQACDPRGEIRDHLVRFVAERDGNGKIVGALAIGRDVTEHKRAEEYERFRSQTLELLSRGASLPDILESIVRGVEQLDCERICSILLLDSDGRHFCKGIAPSLPESYNAALDGLEIGVGVGCCGTAAATGQRVIADDLATHPYWAPYKELVATVGLGACWSEPIHASTGEVLGAFAVYHRHASSPAPFDIALIEKSTHLVSIAIERKRAQEALRTREREFRALAENLPDFLVRYDREGRRTYINPTMERVFALGSEEMLGSSLRQDNPAKLPMPQAYVCALEHTLVTGERSEFEMQFFPAGGGTRTGLCFIVAERGSDGQITGAIAVTRDITELKRNEAELDRHRHHLEKLVDERTLALSAAKEAAEVATRAKSHFLAAASHDLRQPLQAIRLFNDALARAGLSERQKSIYNSLAKSVTSLDELLNDLLDLSRLDAGTIEPHPAMIHAEDLLDTIGLEFDAVCQEKNLELRLVYPQRSFSLFSDENLLLTLLRNLVSNAVKYTKRGGVLVGIRRQEEHALIQVWDTGVGIPPDQTDSIFEEYFQIGNPERDRAKGVGLGLSIVKRLSKLLDVGVRFRSREGKGSVFEVRVPLAGELDVPDSPRQAYANLDTVAPSRLAGKRIVVIEDDGAAGEAIKLTLELEGAAVMLFNTPEEALGSVEAMGADYYLSDYRLPGMNGLQFLDAIQKRSAAPIKAVLLTGNVSPDQMAVLRSSHWKVIFKPVALTELLSALDAR